MRCTQIQIDLILSLRLPPCCGGSEWIRRVRCYGVDTVCNIATTAHTHSFSLRFTQRERGGRGEAVWWRTNSITPPPLPLSHHPQTPKYHHTPGDKLRGFPLCICPFINQPSILHKNMEELLLPQYTPFTMVVVHSNKKSQWKTKKLRYKLNSNKKKKVQAEQKVIPLPEKKKSWYRL